MLPCRIGDMPSAPHDRQRDCPEQWQLSRFERRTIDENGEPSILFDSDAHKEWCAKWAPPCPDGKPQGLRHALGFRERNVRELELRVPLGGDDGGVCQVIVDERDDEVHVRVLVHRHSEDDESAPASREYQDWPVRVWLEHPLGDRAVIDIDTDEELPLYTPPYLDNVPQPDHGYRPAHRRRPAPKSP